MSAAVRQTLADSRMALRFVRDLPAYLRDPLTAPRAAAIVRERLARRERTFLELARTTIYANAASPQRALLLAAGCAEGDLGHLVRKEGLEGALQALCRAGVFVTVDEFKGRKPLVRGSLTLDVQPAAFRNPLAPGHVWSATGGSRGAPVPVRLDLAGIRDRAVDMYLALVARGGAGWRNAVWGLRGMVPVLWYSAAVPRAARWFTQIDPASPDTAPRFRWATRLLAWTSAACATSLPRPEYAPLENPSAILAWIAETLGRHETPHVWSSPSAIVRLCEAASSAGIDVAGTQFTLTGEPVTPARLDVTRRAGTLALADYGSVDSGGTVAYGCLAAQRPDDVHVFGDVNAVIAANVPALPRDALLLTSLLPTAPYVLLNASMGDRATVSDRRCGCRMEACGWTTHLADIRSFEKLTAGGVTFDDGSIVGILEQLLPSRFGGGPTDYQLVEEHGDSPHARLRLLVNPSVAGIELAAVRDAFLGALADGRDVERDMLAQWRALGTLEVCREPPRVSRSGKILHLVAGAAREAP